MRTERIEKTTVLFAVVALSAVTLIVASQNASAAVVHHTTSISVHHKVIEVIPEAHGKSDIVLQNATAMKALTKGPYGESDVIGGMMSGGY
jgi:hypothetical protein